MKKHPIQAIKLLRPKLPTVKDVVHSLVHLPEKFSGIFKAHIWILLPLLATQLLQKCQDLVDDRFISTLGRDALSIHNIQYSLFLIGQEIGLASATSALIFWKRRESNGKQGAILWLHLAMPIALSSVAVAVLFFFLGDLRAYFKVPVELGKNADLYLTLGLANLIFRSAYVPLSAMLIACNQRVKCTLLAAGVLAAKYTVGWLAINYYWDLNPRAASMGPPMAIIAAGSLVVLILSVILTTVWISNFVDGWNKMDMKSIFKVWPGELGIATISALSPLLFGFQVAQAKTSPDFFVTYQLALHFTYILTLPVLAGMQIAVRDASEEQSDSSEMKFKPLHQSLWWPRFFYASLGPSCILLGVAAILAKPIFFYVYNYRIPEAHLIFFPMFFMGWVLWQFGNIFLIMLRASKKNGLATRNFIIAGIGVQVGVTQLLLWNELATPFSLSVVSFAYCAMYLMLNRKAVSEIQSKYYLLTHPKLSF